MDKIYLSPEGYDQYQKELEELKEKLKNNTLNKNLAYESDLGDNWHDNFEFDEARRLENMLMDAIEKKIQGLDNIVIVNEKKILEDTIAINDIVKLRLEFGNTDIEEVYYKLVGTNIPNYESDIAEITLNSPLGKAIYNKKVNDIVYY